MYIVIVTYHVHVMMESIAKHFYDEKDRILFHFNTLIARCKKFKIAVSISDCTCNLYCVVEPKIGFQTISPKINTLRYMLLHKSYINMAIANIFLYRKSLYDLPGRKYKIAKNQKGAVKKGVVPRNVTVVKKSTRVNLFIYDPIELKTLRNLPDQEI